MNFFWTRCDVVCGIFVHVWHLLIALYMMTFSFPYSSSCRLAMVDSGRGDELSSSCDSDHMAQASGAIFLCVKYFSSI